MSPHAGTHLNSAGQKFLGLGPPWTSACISFLTFHSDLTAANTMVSKKVRWFLEFCEPYRQTVNPEERTKGTPFFPVFRSQFCTWSWHLQEKQLCETDVLACKVSKPTSGSFNGIDKQLSNWTKQVKNWLLDGEKQNKTHNICYQKCF